MFDQYSFEMNTPEIATEDMLCQQGILPFRKYPILIRSRTLSKIVAVVDWLVKEQLVMS